MEQRTTPLLSGHSFHRASSLTPRELFLLGNLLGRDGPLCLGGNNSPHVKMLLRGAAAGCAAAGSRVTVHPFASPVQGGWALGKNQAEHGLFLECSDIGHIRIWVLDPWGMPEEEGILLRLEQALRQNTLFKVRDSQIGTLAATPLTPEQWAEEIVSRAALPRPSVRRLTVAVDGPCPANSGLILALQAMGCRVEGQWQPGIPCFSSLRGGFALRATDEQGALVSPDQLLALEVLLEMEQGGGTVTLPPEATAAAFFVAMGYNGSFEYLSKQKNHPTRGRYAAQPWLWSAPSAAVRICSRMRTSGQHLSDLLSKVPRFSRHSRDISFPSAPEQAAAFLTDRPFTPLPGGGIRLKRDGYWLSLLPRATALRITAESTDLDLAAEVCSYYAHRALLLKQSMDADKNSTPSTQKA